MSKAWKTLERMAAKALGGRRNPAAGGTGGPDVLGVVGWVVECKYRGTFAHDNLYRREKQRRKEALAVGTRFALVTRARGQGALVVITLSDFAELIERSKEQ